MHKNKLSTETQYSNEKTTKTGGENRQKGRIVIRLSFQKTESSMRKHLKVIVKEKNA